jgi:hypothetical protein
MLFPTAMKGWYNGSTEVKSQHVVWRHWMIEDGSIASIMVNIIAESLGLSGVAGARSGAGCTVERKDKPGAT